MLPKNNLPCMLGTSTDADDAIAAALDGSLSLEEALSRLSLYFLIRVHFHHPVNLRFLRGYKESNIHTFRCLFISNRGNFCYGYKKNSHSGCPLSLREDIKEIEFLSNIPLEFSSYEKFKARFDPRFIKEEGIKSLWDSKSGQHGGKYNKGDFKSIGKQGLRLMKRFLNHFEDINKPNKETPPYHKSSLWPDQTVWVYSEKYYTNHQLGRDISISYQSNSPYIYYSSEYKGCSNGHYGLIVNENTYLYLEKD